MKHEKLYRPFNHFFSINCISDSSNLIIVSSQSELGTQFSSDDFFEKDFGSFCCSGSFS